MLALCRATPGPNPPRCDTAQGDTAQAEQLDEVALLNNLSVHGVGGGYLTSVTRGPGHPNTCAAPCTSPLQRGQQGRVGWGWDAAGTGMRMGQGVRTVPLHITETPLPHTNSCTTSGTVAQRHCRSGGRRMGQQNANQGYPVSLQQSQDKKFYLLATTVMLVSIRLWHNDSHFNYTGFKLPGFHFAFPFHVTPLLQVANQRQTNTNMCKHIFTLAIQKNTSNKSDSSSSSTHCSLSMLFSMHFVQRLPQPQGR